MEHMALPSLLEQVEFEDCGAVSNLHTRSLSPQGLSEPGGGRLLGAERGGRRGAERIRRWDLY